MVDLSARFSAAGGDPFTLAQRGVDAVCIGDFALTLAVGQVVDVVAGNEFAFVCYRSHRGEAKFFSCLRAGELPSRAGGDFHLMCPEFGLALGFDQRFDSFFFGEFVLEGRQLHYHFSEQAGARIQEYGHSACGSFIGRYGCRDGPAG